MLVSSGLHPSSSTARVTFLGPTLAIIRFGQLGACALSTATLEGINDVMQSLIVALMFSRLDYGSATLASLPKQLMVCAERRCTADLQSLSSGPHSAVTAQITLASDARMRFVPAGSAGASLPPRLWTWLPGFKSSAGVTPQRTSTTALFDYISAGRSTHCAFYHWRSHLSSDCFIGLEQFAGVSPVIAVVASFPQQTENRTFCPVSQTTRNVSLHWLLSLLRDFTVLACFYVSL